MMLNNKKLILWIENEIKEANGEIENFWDEEQYVEKAKGNIELLNKLKTAIDNDEFH